MVSEPFRAYPNECLCLAYRATCYRAAIGPPIIYSPTHELAVEIRAAIGPPIIYSPTHELAVEIRAFHCI